MLDVVHYAVPAGTQSQDRISVVRRAGGALVVLADGAGGCTGGSSASELAVAIATEVFLGRAHDQYRLEPSRWAAVLRRIDHALTRSREGGLTTLVVAEIQDNYVAGAYAGDSVAWLVERDAYAELTGPRGRRPLLGTGFAEPATFGPVPLKGTLLVASDGLLAHTDAAGVIDALSAPLRDAASCLVQSAREHGPHDDVTVALARAA